MRRRTHIRRSRFDEWVGVGRALKIGRAGGGGGGGDYVFAVIIFCLGRDIVFLGGGPLFET